MNEYINPKYKRFKKVKLCYEYAIFFYSSDDMIDFVCRAKLQDILNSKLYTYKGTYQLLITSTAAPCDKSKYIIFKDRAHISEIKLNNRLICKDNALLKIKKAFKTI